ncbi:DUF3310 domain-containing protein [Lysinibacillus fusiformis]|uniref:DUF3310 domain-containing protein n=1 Tax=Lysinibacillus fusiformis TaxID=28031 RepID=UPI0030181BD2
MAKAQKGDLIRITNVLEDWAYPVGGIYEVIEFSDGGYPLFNVPGKDDWCYAKEGQYEIHRKAGEEPEQDAVNPQHYKQGRTEVIDIIEDAVAGAEPFEAVCQANVLKYTLRYRHKNGVEDLKKAVWYAEKLIEHLTQK